MPVLLANRIRLVDSTSQNIRHDISALGIAHEDNAAVRSTSRNVAFDLVLGVVDTICYRCWIATVVVDDCGWVIHCNAGRPWDHLLNQICDLTWLAFTRGFVGSTSNDDIETRCTRLARDERGSCGQGCKAESEDCLDKHVADGAGTSQVYEANGKSE